MSMREQRPAPSSGADRLRHQIDSGETGDKAAFPDPAAAPLGTDAEAAGVSSPAGEPDRGTTGDAHARLQERRGRLRALPLAIAFIVLVMVSVFLTALILGWG